MIIAAVPFVFRLYKLSRLASQATLSELATLETVFLKNDGRRIAGILHVPGVQPQGYVVVAHGNRPAGKDHPLYRRLCSILSRDNVVLAFDFRGYNESDEIGVYTNDFTLDYSSDVESAVDFVARRFLIDRREVILVGHSFGAINVLLASKRLGSRQVIAIGAGDLAKHVDNESWAKMQRNKLSRIGLQVPLGRISLVYEPLLAERVFDGLSPEGLTFVWGDSESGASELRSHIDSLSSEPGRIQTNLVPLADHMYWSEGSQGWFPKMARYFLGEDACEKALGAVIVQSVQDQRRRSMELQNRTEPRSEQVAQ